MRRRILTAVGLATAFLLVARSFSPYLRGLTAAYIDHACGHHDFQEYGELPPPWHDRYGELLREKYGVKLNQVAGCVVTESLVSYVEGYNAATRSRLFERHGKYVFEECWEAAQKEAP